MAFGETKEVASTTYNPVFESRLISYILTGVGTLLFSF